MLNKNFKEIIKIICNSMNREKIKFALIGSSNLALQGINLKPKDLDFVVKLKDLKRISKFFSEYLISDIKKLPQMTNEPAWDVKLKINDVNVQFLGERNNGEYVSKLLRNRIIYLYVDNIKVCCFTLEAEAQAYSETNREKKAKIIREYLERIEHR